jgi:hypothetical protein
LPAQAFEVGHEASLAHAAAEPLAQVMELGPPPQTHLDGGREPRQDWADVELRVRIDDPQVATG